MPKHIVKHIVLILVALCCAPEAALADFSTVAHRSKGGEPTANR
jgi:hypothetical protein